MVRVLRKRNIGKIDRMLLLIERGLPHVRTLNIVVFSPCTPLLALLGRKEIKAYREIK